MRTRLGWTIVNLSKDVFERRMSTGSGFFSFLDSGFAHFLGQLVSIIVKTLRNTNLGASRCFKMKKTSLPVDVRRSKTPLLKLPNFIQITVFCPPKPRISAFVYRNAGKVYLRVTASTVFFIRKCMAVLPSRKKLAVITR